MSAPVEAMDTEALIAEQAMQDIEVVEAGPESAKVVVKVPKSPRTPRPKKDKQNQPMLLVRISLRNTHRTNLTLQEKGKAINPEVDEEEFEEILVDEEDVEIEVETQGVDPITRLL